MIVRGLPAALTFSAWTCLVGCATGLILSLLYATSQPCRRGKCDPCDRSVNLALCWSIGCLALAGACLAVLSSGWALRP